jgi:hypothetical protein
VLAATAISSPVDAISYKPLVEPLLPTLLAIIVRELCGFIDA